MGTVNFCQSIDTPLIDITLILSCAGPLSIIIANFGKLLIRWGIKGKIHNLNIRQRMIMCTYDYERFLVHPCLSKYSIRNFTYTLATVHNAHALCTYAQYSESVSFGQTACMDFCCCSNRDISNSLLVRLHQHGGTTAGMLTTADMPAITWKIATSGKRQNQRDLQQQGRLQRLVGLQQQGLLQQHGACNSRDANNCRGVCSNRDKAT